MDNNVISGVTLIGYKGEGSGQVENPGEAVKQTEVIGEETHRLIESATSQAFSMQDKESLSPMDVEETIEQQKEGKDETNKSPEDILKAAKDDFEEEKEEDEQDLPASSLIDSPCEDDFAVLNSESLSQGLAKNTVPPPQETKSMKFIESNVQGADKKLFNSLGNASHTDGK